MRSDFLLTVTVAFCLASNLPTASAQLAVPDDSLASRVIKRTLFPDQLTYASATTPSDGDTQPLWDLVQWLDSGASVQEQLAAFENLISSYPSSPWTPSLRANLATFYRKQGQFSLALAHWEAAWTAVHDQKNAGAKGVGDFVLGNWTELLASLGQTERLGQILAETSGRTLDGGPWQQRYNASQEAWARMVSNPSGSYRCGITALAALAKVLSTDGAVLPRLNGELATDQGLSFADLSALAQKYQIPLVAVELPPDADPVVPSVVHYQLGHFAAILARDGNRYQISDPVFRQLRWIKGSSIKSESSGRYLVPANMMSASFRQLTLDEQAQTRGRGYPNVINDNDDTFQPISAGLGLPSWRISEPYLNLWLQAPIVRYPLPGGLSGGLDLTFKQRNSRNTANAFNFGPSWECSWLSYVDYTDEYDENSNPPNYGYYLYFSDMYMPSAGVNLYTVDSSGNGTTYYNFSKFRQNFTHVIESQRSDQLATTPFSATMVNGAYFAYLQDQYFSLGQHRSYLSTLKDPQGRTATFTYFQSSGVMCLSNVVDFNGTSTLLLYQSPTAGQVTAVVDPFGRTNSFGYNGSGYLVGITNPLSFGPVFTYDSQGMITNLNTPYGNTAFIYSVNTNAGNVVNRSMEVVLPWGGKHLYAYRDQSTYLNATSSVPLLPWSYPSNSVPNTGSFTNTFDNTWMDGRNSFYWSPRTFLQLSSGFQSSGDFNTMSTNDYKVGRLRHWLAQVPGGGTLSGTLSMQRDPSPDGIQDGQRTWFDYWGKSPTVETNGTTDWYSCGSSAEPRFVAFLRPDGSSRYTYKEYNAMGNPTREIGTWGVGPLDVFVRTNSLVYGTNLVDLVAVYNTAGELIASNVWNTIHQVVTNYNALMEQTTSYYQSGSPYLLLGTVAPNGLASTNYYYSSGTINYLQSTVVPALSVTNSFTYTNGLIYTHTNERGLTFTNTYDNLQRVVAAARPDGATTTSYSNLTLLSVVDRMGNTSRFGYDLFGRKIWDADALGRTNRYGYTGSGELQSITNALGQASTYVYDNLAEVLTILRPDGTGSTNTYNSLGQVVSTVDATGYAVNNYYNNQGLLAAVSNAVGLMKLVQCDVRDRTTNSIDATGTSVSASYDLLGRVATQRFADGGSVSFGYSPNIGSATSSTNQLQKATFMGYDLAGRLTATTNANNEVVRQAYGVSGELLSLTDGRNQTTSWGYDQYGRQTSKTNASGVRILAYQFDPLDRMTNRWSAAHTNTAYAYDAVGNLLSIVYPRSPAITFQYDALNRVTNRTDAAGTLTYAFNNAGKLISEGGLWSADTVTYSYANNYLLQSFSVAQPNASPWVQSYSYDSVERLQTLTSPAGSFGYQYNPGLNGYTTDSALIQKITVPNGASITNSFDPVGRELTTTLVNSQGGLVDNHAYAYDLAGEITNIVRFDSSSAAYKYDNIGQLTSAKATDPGSVTRLHEQFAYGYDNAHNLGSKTNNALVESFSVDALNQLTTIGWNGTLTVAGTTTSPATNVTVNGSPAIRYADNSFAGAGFALTVGPNSFTAVANDSFGRASSNAVTVNLSASASYSYDLNGNLLSDGLRGYDYDDADQLIRITSTNSWKSEFTYDGLGQRRVRTEYLWQNGNWQVSSVTLCLYAGGLVIQERNASNVPLVSYTRGPDRGGGIGGLLARTDQATQINAYYHADANGNVTTLLDSSQFILARYLYDPYGNVIASSGPLAQANTYRYASKEVHAASELIYFGCRFYNPSLQRWMNRDPIQESGGINLFGYVGNSPIHRIDPCGRFWGSSGRSQPGDDIGGNWTIGNLVSHWGSGMGLFIAGIDVTYGTDNPALQTALLVDFYQQLGLQQNTQVQQSLGDFAKNMGSGTANQEGATTGSSSDYLTESDFDFVAAANSGTPASPSGSEGSQLGSSLFGDEVAILGKLYMEKGSVDFTWSGGNGLWGGELRLSINVKTGEIDFGWGIGFGVGGEITGTANINSGEDRGFNLQAEVAAARGLYGPGGSMSAEISEAGINLSAGVGGGFGSGATITVGHTFVVYDPGAPIPFYDSTLGQYSGGYVNLTQTINGNR